MQHPVVIIGAGPIGLAAAANAAERGMDFVVLEAGPYAGAAVGEWAHVRLFSSWSELVDPAARRLLDASKTWTAPDDAAYPTGREWRDGYLQPLADVAQIAGRGRQPGLDLFNAADQLRRAPGQQLRAVAVVGTVQQIVRVGHAGAKATWDGVVDTASTPGGGDGDD